MAARTKKVGRTGRFGARYGWRIKLRLGEIEKVLKAKHVCPGCNAAKVHRIAKGIWQCKKCDLKFAGGAYNPAPKIELKPLESKIVSVPEFEKGEAEQQAKKTLAKKEA